MTVGRRTITGLPDQVDLDHPAFYALQEAIDRGVFEITAEAVEGVRGYGGKFKLTILPRGIPEHWQASPRGEWFDPAHYRVGEFGRIACLDPSVFAGPDGCRDGLLFRGMCYEEFCQARERGYFESRGACNLGGEQVGLTYFSKDAGQAAHYANGFAPWQFKATPDHPAVMVSIRDQLPHVPVAGTGEDEVGLAGRIPFSLVESTLFAHPISMSAGFLEIVEDPWKKTDRFSPGSGVGLSISTAWTPLEIAPHKRLEQDHAMAERVDRAREAIRATTSAVHGQRSSRLP